jgi:hypothetical protein
LHHVYPLTIVAFLARTMYDCGMKVQRVYIDTSVLGGCFDVEFAEWSNALMDDFRNGRLKPVLSDVIEAEIQDAPEVVQALYIGLLTLSPEVVSSTNVAVNLADVYQ